MNPFGVGVVGIGDISDVYLANLARFGDIVRVVGCAGRDVEKARRKAAQHNLPKRLRDGRRAARLTTRSRSCST